MSLARGKFGIEYNPRQVEPESSGFGWIVVVVLAVAGLSFAVAYVRHLRTQGGELAEASCAAAAVPPSAPSALVATNAPPVVPPSAYAARPPRVRNLLMRLEEAARRRDVEMEISTIEAIRALPGAPAADLDDALARRLGSLNLHRLFGLRSAQWVKTVTVRRGDSASRIAAENGSTIASLARLNGGDVGMIRLGAKLFVMDHPRFNLVLRRRTRIADLSLNGKFFKRYDLRAEVRAREGAYEMPERRKLLWDGLGAVFGRDDRAELELLLPVKSPVLVSEM